MTDFGVVPVAQEAIGCNHFFCFRFPLQFKVQTVQIRK